MNKLKNVIIISIDCLNREALSCYCKKFDSLLHKNLFLLTFDRLNIINKFIVNPLMDNFCKSYVKPNTPNIDCIASEGTIFTQAVTQAPFTPSAHASLLTGMYPFHHGIRAMIGFKLDKKIKTLAEILQSQNFSTAAFVGSSALGEQYELNRGFSVYDFRRGQFLNKVGPLEIFKRYCGEVTRRALEWLDYNKKNNFFIFLHYFDLHEDNASRVTFQPFFQINKMKEIDRHIGLLCTFLKNNHLYDDSLIVICADHGNDFGVHENSHREYLYDSTLLIPLITKGFLNLNNRCFRRQVRIIDIVPSILYSLGIIFHDSESNMDGTILNDNLLLNKRELYAYSETCAEKSIDEWNDFRSSYVSLRSTQWKLIVDRISKRKYLFDLLNDRKEQSNVYDSHIEDANKMLNILLGIMKNKDIYTLPCSNMNKGEIIHDKETLRSLGYL